MRKSEAIRAIREAIREQGKTSVKEQFRARVQRGIIDEQGRVRRHMPGIAVIQSKPKASE